MVLARRPRGRGAGRVREVGPRLRRGRPGHRHRPDGPALAGQDRRRPAGGAGQRRLAGLRPPVRADAQRASRSPAATASAVVAARDGAAAADGLPGPRQQALDLGAVRPHGHGRHACSGRAATPRSCASTAPAAAWRSPPTARRATATPIRSIGGTQAVAEAWRNLTAVGARPLAITNCLNFGNPERPRDHGPARRLHRGHGRGLPGARLPGRVRQRLALQRDRRPGDPADADRGRRRPDRRPGAHGRDRAGTRTASRWCWSASAWAGSAARSTARARWAARKAHRRRSTSPPSGATATSSGPDRAPAGRGLPRPGRRRPRRGRGRDGLAERHRARHSICPPTRGSAAGWLFGEDQARYLLAVSRRPTLRGLLAAAAAAGVIARRVGRTGGDALTLGGRYPHIARRAASDARGLAARLHGRRRGLTGARPDGDDRQPRSSGRSGRACPTRSVTIEDLAGDGDHYRAAHRLRAVPRQVAAAAASARLQGAGRAHGRRAARAGPDHLSAGLSAPSEGRHACMRHHPRPHPAADRGRRRRALHEGHARVPDVRLLRRVVQVLSHVGVPVPVLQHPGRRGAAPGHQGVLQLADHPAALRQGEFVGGCDIVREMHQAGELAQMLGEKGIALKPVAAA